MNMEDVKVLWEDGWTIAIVIVDTKVEDYVQKLQDACKPFAEKRIFPIVVFIANSYDWTIGTNIDLGKWAWFVVASEQEAMEIADGIQGIVDVQGLINLDANDVKTILYGNSDKRSYYATGEDLTGNTGTAIENAVKYSQSRGLDIKDYKKVLISINYNSALSREQMEPLNGFLDKLSALHPDSFECKWGVAVSHDMPEGAVRITLLA